jgi:hypothetical protein
LFGLTLPQNQYLGVRGVVLRPRILVTGANTKVPRDLFPLQTVSSGFSELLFLLYLPYPPDEVRRLEGAYHHTIPEEGFRHSTNSHGPPSADCTVHVRKKKARITAKPAFHQVINVQKQPHDLTSYPDHPPSDTKPPIAPFPYPPTLIAASRMFPCKC